MKVLPVECEASLGPAESKDPSLTSITNKLGHRSRISSCPKGRRQNSFASAPQQRPAKGDRRRLVVNITPVFVQRQGEPPQF